MKICVFEKVMKRYSANEIALHDISLTIEEGEFTALAGPSGSGKTTVLNLAAGLDLPSQGEVHLLGKNLRQLSSQELAHTRRNAVGFIFQSYNLFPILTAQENVEYLLALGGLSPAVRNERAKKALEEVGLQGLGNRMPSQLSGGQQQRVAIARAIVTRPKVVFADEPTANLDSKTAVQLLALFRELNEKLGITFVFSSHDQLVLTSAKRIIEISDGLIKSDTSNKSNSDKSTRLVVVPDPSRGRPAAVCQRRVE